MAKPSSALMGLRAPESALPRCQGSNGVCIAYARVKPEKVVKAQAQEVCHA